MSKGFRDCSLNSLGCHTERPLAASNPSLASLPHSGGHSTLNHVKVFITEEITFLFWKFTQSACVSSSYVSQVYFIKLMSVGEKLKSIILCSQFDHNIYNIQTWLTKTNARGKYVFTRWVITLKALRMSKVVLLVRVCLYKCVIDSALSSAILSFTCALTELLHLLLCCGWLLILHRNPKIKIVLHQHWADNLCVRAHCSDMTQYVWAHSLHAWDASF